MAGGRVLSPMLRRLAVDRATGTLVRDQGRLYLVDGRVAHAESPFAPGPEVLLGTAGHGAPSAGAPAVGAGERDICRLSALYDAAFFALAPGCGPARFRYGAPGSAGPGRPVSAVDVEQETLRRRALLDRVWPHPAVDTAPVLPAAAPDQPRRRPGPRARALLEHADGVRTPTQLAWALGRPAFHTLLEVRRLAAAGLVETPRPPAAPSNAPITPVIPPQALPPPGADPDIDLLRRVRDLLEARL
ncbi:transcriptional regulator [Streptomyces sp. MUM 203J]|uniref:transcriptional regulator n=1 Tax=Streptomyces sp. MUM 203J TaxID=2791990 RepID=UPI001F049F47|nr:transcriptional regulator [Streptomyces sp. MUM 203J]MCH0538389.1 transcriptional regulator [Streptomyces sp. MUM 203J]